MFAGIGTCGQPAFHRGLRQQRGVRNHGLHGGLHGLDGVGQIADFVLGADVQRKGKVALGHFAGTLNQLGRGRGNAAGNDPTGGNRYHGGKHTQNGEQAYGAGGLLFCYCAGLFNQAVLQVAEIQHRLVVFVLGFAQLAGEQGHEVRLLGICFDQLQGFFLRGHIGRPAGLDLGHRLLALLAGHDLIQLVQGFADFLAFFRNAVQ